MPTDRKARARTALVVFLAWTLLTLPLGILVLGYAADSECDPDSDFQILCTPHEEVKDLQTIGSLLITLWLLGSVVILMVAAAKKERHSEDVHACPRCGRDVSIGAPTCLSCGYNLVARR